MEQPTEETSLYQLTIDSENSPTLRTAATWAKVLAVMGFIFGALFIAGGIYYYNKLMSVSDFPLGPGYEEYRLRRENAMSTTATWGLVIFLIMGTLTIIGSVFAFIFGNKTIGAIDSTDSSQLSNGIIS